MKTYQISVVCSDATTFSTRIFANAKKEAQKYANGVSDLYQTQGKNIFIKKVELVKNPY